MTFEQKARRWFFAFMALMFAYVGAAYAEGVGDVSGSEQAGVVIKAVFDSANNMVAANPFKETGAGLFKILLLILISWKSIMLLLDTSSINKVIAELISIILLAGIAQFFLIPETQTQFAKGFSDLAAQAASASGAKIDMNSPQNSISNVLGDSMKAAQELWEGPLKPQKPDVASDSFAPLKWLSEAWSSLSVKDMLGSLAAMIYRALIAILIVSCTVIYLAQMIFSQIMVNIGLIVAPIFVPWILWDATRFLFDGWIKFMIVTGVQKIVGALLFGMTVGMVSSVTTLATEAGATGALNFYAYSTAFVLVALMALMMMQITSIASGLVTGHPQSGFKAPAGMTPGGMLNRGGGGASMKSIGSGAGRAASGIKGAAVGGFQGAKESGSLGAISGAASGAFKGFRGAAPAGKPAASAKFPTKGTS